MFNRIEISGFRGFGNSQCIDLALPNNSIGGGITFIVGANNTGKTTILESLRYFNTNGFDKPSISERKRNIKTNGKVEIKLIDDLDTYCIKSDQRGGSETERLKNGSKYEELFVKNIFVLQSRRFMNYEFHKSEMSRFDYIRTNQVNNFNRTHTLEQFSSRLFNMYNNKKAIDNLLEKIIGIKLNWTIELNENGLYYLKIINEHFSHSSEGLGDGIWSVFTICDALFDSNPGDTIAIDEPELSLHPSYQKRMMKLFKDYSKDRQIIISTHSPYFIDIESLLNGAHLIRSTKNDSGDIELFMLTEKTTKNLGKFSGNIYQPHILDIVAKEAFFLEDNVILVEGQEDAVIYPIIEKEIGLFFEGNIFGWGVGGAGNMDYILEILKELGYKKVVTILDGNMKDKQNELKNRFENYLFLNINADDIRDKESRKATKGKSGIVNKDNVIKTEYKEDMKNLINDANLYFKTNTST